MFFSLCFHKLVVHLAPIFASVTDFNAWLQENCAKTDLFSWFSSTGARSRCHTSSFVAPGSRRPSPFHDANEHGWCKFNFARNQQCEVPLCAWSQHRPGHGATGLARSAGPWATFNCNKPGETAQAPCADMKPGSWKKITWPCRGRGASQAGLAAVNMLAA